MIVHCATETTAKCIAQFPATITLPQDEWRHLIAGGTTTPQKLPNPASEWMTEKVWSDILTLPSLKAFAKFAEEFPEHAEGFKTVFDSQEPHKYVHVCSVMHVHPVSYPHSALKAVMVEDR